MPARILVVDDFQQNLVQVELFLDSEEFDVSTSTSGPDALAVLARKDFDLVLLDVVLPGMDGLEICRRIQADPRTSRIPVLFLTGRARDEAARIAAFEAGGVDFLTKPFGRAELVARVRRALAVHRRLAEREDEIVALNEELAVASDRARAAVADHDRLLQVVDGAVQARALGEVVIVGDRVAAVDDSLGKRLALAHGAAIADCDPRLAELVGHARSGASRAIGSLGPVDLPMEFRAVGDGSIVIGAPEASGAGLERFVDERRPARTRNTLPVTRGSGGYRLRDFIGEHPDLLGLTATVDRLRSVRAPVLIEGETGTGKELVARALHFDGRYHDRPFIPIHCGAIAPELIESELFGYERGAFTGAQSSKDGLFTAADGGTVFLDEIAECSLDLQVKLLRVLQLGEVRPVGATHARHVDVRILAATNRDLAGLVRERRFREDLYYRLECVTLRIPPLRQRRDDVPRLIEHFLARFHEQLAPLQPVEALSKGALDVMCRYSWPGNVRELENVVKGLVALGRGPIAQVEDLPPRIVAGTDPTGVTAPPASILDGRALALQQARADRDAIVDALARFDGDKERAAAWLGISRATLYRKLKGLRSDSPS